MNTKKKAIFFMLNIQMLNILNLKVKHTNKNLDVVLKKNNGEDTYQTRHFPPATKEWFNSTYTYNKNTPKLFPIADKFIVKLIKSYFNLFSRKLERKLRWGKLRLFHRKRSTNRVLISRAELKHTSDKITITFFVYNRQKIAYLKKSKKIALRILKQKKAFVQKIVYLLKKAFKVIWKVRRTKMSSFNNYLARDYFKHYETKFSKKFIKKALKREMLYMAYTRILCFNKSKFDNRFILPLKTFFVKVYNKKIQLNIVSLKSMHLNSDILSQIITIKLKNRKNRILRVLKFAFKTLKKPKLRKFQLIGKKRDRINYLQNLRISDLINNSFYTKINVTNKDTLNPIIAKFFRSELENVNDNNKSNSLDNIFFNSLKHKSINGIRIEASGRLTKRITASRSIFKLKYLGNIKNIDSSFKGYSSVILRGHLRSNLQYTKIKSKTRIGSYGLKTWVSSA
uniref:Small ribosomal subunit protein uS3m n=1 Tax=Pertusaria propinqua TaxID=2283411 RepID=A0A482JW39_9LECA|nr:ribosomal protein S3 [Pertusaria propinqua]